MHFFYRYHEAKVGHFCFLTTPNPRVDLLIQLSDCCQKATIGKIEGRNFFLRNRFFPQKSSDRVSNMFLDTSNVNRNIYTPFKAHCNRFTDTFSIFQNFTSH
eukprot:UN05554